MNCPITTGSAHHRFRLFPILKCYWGKSNYSSTRCKAVLKTKFWQHLLFRWVTLQIYLPDVIFTCQERSLPFPFQHNSPLLRQTSTKIHKLCVIVHLRDTSLSHHGLNILFYPHFYHNVKHSLEITLPHFHSFNPENLVSLHPACCFSRKTFIYKLTRYCWSGLSPFSSVTNFPIRLCSSAKSSGSSFINKRKKNRMKFLLITNMTTRIKHL